MKLDRALERDRKRNKNKMIVQNKSIFILEEQKKKKAEKLKRKYEKQNQKFIEDLEKGE